MNFDSFKVLLKFNYLKTIKGIFADNMYLNNIRPYIPNNTLTKLNIFSISDGPILKDIFYYFTNLTDLYIRVILFEIRLSDIGRLCSKLKNFQI